MMALIRLWVQYPFCLQALGNDGPDQTVGMLVGVDLHCQHT